MAGKKIIVVGAGIVGLSSALWLQRSGFEVTLVDRRGPGQGASFGNAAIMGVAGFVPVNSPSIAWRLPRLLFSSGSPLSISWAYSPHLFGWIMRFLRNCTPARVDYIAGRLHGLLARNLEFATPLLNASGAMGLMKSNGFIYAYEKERDFDEASAEIRLIRRYREDIVDLSRSDIRRMEPNLADIFCRGLFFPDVMQYGDPAAVCQALAAHFTGNGGTLLQASVREIRKLAPGRMAVIGDGLEAIEADQIVLAAGAHSSRLFGAVVESLPLETERGYHVQFQGADVLRASVACPSAGFAMTQLDGALRCAGMVELAGLDREPTPANHAYIARTARRYIPDLPEPSSRWMGFRPTMPDALPVIGRSARTPEIVLAFGHQHLGMSSGFVTGRMVAAIAQDAASPVDPAPFAPTRFA